MAIWIFRGLFVIAGTAAAYSICPEDADPYKYMLVGLVICGGLVLAEWFFSRSPISVITSVVFGSIVGIVLAVLTRAVVELQIGHIEDPALRGQAVDGLNTAVYKKLMAEGITIPFPQREVHFRQPTPVEGTD